MLVALHLFYFMKKERDPSFSLIPPSLKIVGGGGNVGDVWKLIRHQRIDVDGGTERGGPRQPPTDTSLFSFSLVNTEYRAWPKTQGLHSPGADTL